MRGVVARLRAVACAGVAAGALLPAMAWAQATALAPPAMYPPGTWQGKGTAVVRVLDKLDSHVEELKIPVGTAGHYKGLTVTAGRCLQRPPTLSPDAAAWLDIQDTLPNGAVFRGWMLAAEPSLGVFESPVYDVRMVQCEGEDTPPGLPPLPQPVVPTLPQANSSTAGQADPSTGPAPVQGTQSLPVPPPAGGAAQPRPLPAPVPFSAPSGGGASTPENGGVY